MHAANVGKLTLQRFDGLHFIPSTKLNKFIQRIVKWLCQLVQFCYKTKTARASFCYISGVGYKTRKTLNYFLISERFNFKCQRKKQQLKILIDSNCMLMDPSLKSLKDPKILKQVGTRQSFLEYDLNVQCQLLTCLASINLRIQGSSLVQER